MYTIYTYLSDAEARAEHRYRQVYYTEYMRVYETGRSTDRERLLLWSELAHRAGKSARDRILANEAVASVSQDKRSSQADR